MLHPRFHKMAKIQALFLLCNALVLNLEAQTTRITPVTPQSMIHHSQINSPLEIKKMIPPGNLPKAPATNYGMDAAAAGSVQNTIETIIRDQLAALREGDFSKAYYAYTSVEFQKAVPFETFKSFVKKSTPMFRNRSFNLKSINFSGVIANVKGQLEAFDGRYVNVKYDLINEYNNWKIRKIDLLVTF